MHSMAAWQPWQKYSGAAATAATALPSLPMLTQVCLTLDGCSHVFTTHLIFHFMHTIAVTRLQVRKPGLQHRVCVCVCVRACVRV